LNISKRCKKRIALGLKDAAVISAGPDDRWRLRRMA
jgi:hypothetical protein